MTRFIRWVLVVLVVLGFGCGSSTPDGSGGIQGRVTLGSVTSPPSFPVTASGPRTVAGTVNGGSYSLAQLPAGAYVVSVSVPSTREGTLSTSVTVEASVAVATTLAFTPLGTITGVVTLGRATGNAGITVTVLGASAVALTDDAGNYSLPLVPAGKQTIIASFSGYASGTVMATVPYAAQGKAPPITLATSAYPGSITGSVVLSNTAAQSGLVLTLAGQSSGVATTTAGSYSFTGLQPGAYTVTASVPSSLELIASVQVTVAATAAVAPPIDFTAVGTLTGTVTLYGEADSSGIEVSIPALGLEAVTDSAGAFTLTRAPAGPQSLLASLDGFVSATASATVVYDTSTVVPPIVLNAGQMQPFNTQTLEGQAILFDQASSAGTIVQVVGTPALTATTLADGTYAIADVPVGVVSLSFSNTLFGLPYTETLQGVAVAIGGTGTIVGPSQTGTATTTYSLSQTPMFVPKGSRIESGATKLPTFTPDGTKALLTVPSSQGGTKTELAPLDGSAPLVFSSTLVDPPTQFVFSADGTELAYTVATSGSLYDIDTYPVAGGVVTTLATGVANPELRAAGSRLVWYSSVYVGPTSSAYTLGVYSAPFTGGVPTTLFSGSAELSAGLDVTADGTHVVWEYELPASGTAPATFFIVSVPTAGGTSTTLATGPAYLYLEEVSGDSRYVVYSSNPISSPGPYFSVPVDGGTAVPLAPAGTVQESYPYEFLETVSVSDYALTVYDVGGVWGLYSSPLAGGSAPVLVEGPLSVAPDEDYDIESLGVSPDGNHFCFSNYTPSAPYSILCAPMAGGTAVSVGSASSAYPQLVFSTDSQHVVWSDLRALYSTPVTGGSPETLLAAGLNSYVALDAEHMLAFFESASGVGTLASISLIGAAQTVLATDVSGFDLSPDHSRVAYTSYTTGWLYTAPTAGGSTTPISNFAPSAGAFAWTAATHQLVYVESAVPSPYNFQDGVYGVVVP